MSQLRDFLSFRSPGRIHRTSFFRIREFFGITLVVLALIGAYLVNQNIAEPVRARVRGLEKQIQEQQNRGVKARQERIQIERDQKLYKDVVQKLKEFEANNFLDARSGQLALIDEVNALARKNKIRLADTVSFQTADPTDDEKNAQAALKQRVIQTKTEKGSLIFPTFTVKFAISGDYRQIRAFVHDLEESRQFLVLKLLTVTPEKTGPAGRNGFSGQSAPVGSPDDITLSLEMTAFYRR